MNKYKLYELGFVILTLPFLVPIVTAGLSQSGVFNIGFFGGSAVTLGSKTSASSMPVVIASDQAAVPVSFTATPSTGVVMGIAGFPVGVYNPAKGVPLFTRVGCTTSSGVLLAANANRVGLECESEVTNTDRVFTNWGALAATNVMHRIEVGGSWQPLSISSVAIQCLSNSGTQQIGCTEYVTQ